MPTPPPPPALTDAERERNLTILKWCLLLGIGVPAAMVAFVGFMEHLYELDPGAWDRQ